MLAPHLPPRRRQVRRAVKPLMKEPRKRRTLRVSVLLSLIFLGLATAFMPGCAQHGSPACVTTVVGTNVLSASACITHGPSHTFYYPSQLRWEWDTIRKRLGFRIKPSSEKLNASPVPPSDVLWVAFTYREELHDPKLLVAEELIDGVHTRCHHSFGGVLDGSRRAAVAKWPLPGGVESYRGKTFHIRTMTRGKELATIQIR